MPYRTLWYRPGQQEYGCNTVRCNTGKRHVGLACSQMKCALNITQLTTLRYQKGPGISLVLNLFPFLSQVKASKLPASMSSTQVSGYATLWGKLLLASFSIDDGNFLLFAQIYNDSGQCPNISGFFWTVFSSPAPIALISLLTVCSFKIVSSEGEHFTARG